jgi:hypothetical protein
MDYDYYGPYYDQPHQHHSPEGGAMQEESRHFPMTRRWCVGPWTSTRQGWRSMMHPPTQLSGSRCINSPSKPPVGTHTSWQTTFQSTCHHPPGPGSSGFPRGQFIPGTTYAGCSPITSVPRAHIRESTGT